VARAGDVIENPRTGERIVFRKTAADTNGELLEMDFFVAPGGIAPRKHLHLDVEERFIGVDGTLKLWVGGKETTLGAGETAVVPVGVGHTFWAEGEETAHFVAEIAPAREMETLFETVWGLYRDGKTNRHGHEALLQGAVLAKSHASVAAGPPVALQRPVIAGLAALGRLMGYRERYERYSGTER
jgi:quercetin dioxygenase-like cupin family protein